MPVSPSPTRTGEHPEPDVTRLELPGPNPTPLLPLVPVVLHISRAKNDVELFPKSCVRAAAASCCRPQVPPARMSRLLLQSISNTAPIPLGAPPPAGISKSGMIYTFAFIGASTLVGMCFLMVVFKYVVSYRHWRPPNTTPLQVGTQRAPCTVQWL